jgi:hypothetical protein
MAQLFTLVLGSLFIASYDTRGYGGGIPLLLMSELSYHRRSFGQSVLVSDHHLGPATIFSFAFIIIIFKHLLFFLLWGALPDERTSL